ncbi:MAG: hypothetical protein Q9191_006260 [Dirinaria sp. TL-2023a]
MAAADPEWLLWAKRQKDQTQTLAERLQGQSRIIDKLLPLQEQVKELLPLKEQVKELQPFAERFHTQSRVVDKLLPLREQVQELQPFAEQVQAQSRFIDELLPIRGQVKQLQHEVQSLQKCLSSAQQAEIDDLTLAARLQSRSNVTDGHQQQMKALQHEIESLRKNLSSAQQASKDARARYEADINKADLRIIKLTAEKRSLAKELEKCRAQTAKTVTDIQQQNEDTSTLLNREVAHLRTKYEEQTMKLSILTTDYQRSLAALEERNNAINNRRTDVQTAELTTRAVESNNAVSCTRSSELHRGVQRFLDDPLKLRSWSGKAQSTSPVASDDDETRDTDEDHGQCLSVDMTEASTLIRCAHAEQPIRKEEQAEISLITPLSTVLEPQGNRFLDEYITLSEDSIPPLLLAYEAKIVEAFVAGLRQEEHRVAMRRRLDKAGWTWKMTFEEINHVLREGRAIPTIGTKKLQQLAAPQPRTANGRFAKRKRRT